MIRGMEKEFDRQIFTPSEAPSSAPTSSACHVVILSDAPNDMVEQPFQSQLERAIRTQNPNQRFVISSSPLLNRVNTPQGTAELQDKLNQPATLAVALLGVPVASTYIQEVHHMLNAWSANRRPALLIASADPTATRKAIASWPGLASLSPEWQKAIMVNDEYIVAQSGEKALAQIQKADTLAQSLPHMQTPPRIPSATVRQPHMEEAQLGTEYFARTRT
jgi:hypothetical protein